MLEKTQAVVVKIRPFRDNSSIILLYTEKFGLKHYIVQTNRHTKNKNKGIIFHPLQIIEIIVNNRNNQSLSYIKEYSTSIHLSNLQTDIVKTSLCFFIDEVIYLSLKEDNISADVFNFLIKSIILLNDSEGKLLRDFHIYFLYNFACLLGFEPMDNYTEKACYFNSSSGMFVESETSETSSAEESLLFHNYIGHVCGTYIPYTSSLSQRRLLLNMFVNYFESHIIYNSSIKSHYILQSIL